MADPLDYYCNFCRDIGSIEDPENNCCEFFCYGDDSAPSDQKKCVNCEFLLVREKSGGYQRYDQYHADLPEPQQSPEIDEETCKQRIIAEHPDFLEVD